MGTGEYPMCPQSWHYPGCETEYKPYHFPDRYYEYDNTTKTITMNLSSIALRGFTSRELAPHNERSVINRVPKVLQVSSDFLYGKVRQDYCGGHGLIVKESSSKNIIRL